MVSSFLLGGIVNHHNLFTPHAPLFLPRKASFTPTIFLAGQHPGLDFIPDCDNIGSLSTLV